MARGFLSADAKEGAQAWESSHRGGGDRLWTRWETLLEEATAKDRPRPPARRLRQLSLGVAFGGTQLLRTHGRRGRLSPPCRERPADPARQAGGQQRAPGRAGCSLQGRSGALGAPQGTPAGAAAEAHAWEELGIQPRFIEDLLGAGRVVDAATYGISR